MQNVETRVANLEARTGGADPAPVVALQDTSDPDLYHHDDLEALAAGGCQVVRISRRPDDPQE